MYQSQQMLQHLNRLEGVHISNCWLSNVQGSVLRQTKGKKTNWKIAAMLSGCPSHNATQMSVVMPVHARSMCCKMSD